MLSCFTANFKLYAKVFYYTNLAAKMGISRILSESPMNQAVVAVMDGTKARFFTLEEADFPEYCLVMLLA